MSVFGSRMPVLLLVCHVAHYHAVPCFTIHNHISDIHSHVVPRLNHVSLRYSQWHLQMSEKLHAWHFPDNWRCEWEHTSTNTLYRLSCFYILMILMLQLKPSFKNNEIRSKTHGFIGRSHEQVIFGLFCKVTVQRSASEQKLRWLTSSSNLRFVLFVCLFSYFKSILHI